MATNLKASDDNVITLNYGQSTSDYFGDGASDLTPTSTGISYTRHISDDWTVSAAYQDSEGDDRWLAIETDNLRAFSGAKVDSNGYGLSVSWDSDSYSLSLSYNLTDTEENSVTFLPRILESLNSETQVFNFSIDQSVDLSPKTTSQQWSFDWGAGIQQAYFDAQIIELINLETPVRLDSNITLEQLSGYIDLGLSYWVEQNNYAWAPFISVSWNVELNTSGQQTVFLSRGGDARPVNLLDGRFTSDVNIPDSGQWEIGVGLLFDSGWSADLVYGQSIATDYPIENVTASISVFF
jgi:hypothetical protein